MNYQKLSDYMQSEHGVILLETDMQEIVNICREIEDLKHPLKNHKGELLELSSLPIKDKEDIINAWLQVAGSLAMETFYSIGLKDFMGSNVINDANGDVFKLSFKKINP